MGDGTKYTIEVNEYQLRVIMSALDMYSRMGMGQLTVAIGEFFTSHFWSRLQEPVNPLVELKRDEVARELVESLQLTVFDHPPNASWGIFNTEVPSACREAYDIQQVLRKTKHDHNLDLKRKNEAPIDIMERWSVDGNDYHPTNPEQPPVVCKAKEIEHG